jgi:hypothetical protein
VVVVVVEVEEVEVAEEVERGRTKARVTTTSTLIGRVKFVARWLLSVSLPRPRPRRLALLPTSAWQRGKLSPFYTCQAAPRATSKTRAALHPRRLALPAHVPNRGLAASTCELETMALPSSLRTSKLAPCHFHVPPAAAAATREPSLVGL